MSALAHSPARDRAWGRFLGRHGAARVLREAEHPLPNTDRVLAWRQRSREPGMGNPFFFPAESAGPRAAPPLAARSHTARPAPSRQPDNPFIGDEPPELIAHYPDICGV